MKSKAANGKADPPKEKPAKGKKAKATEAAAPAPAVEEKPAELLPVSLLCGFLGAGKTTLLKHILETKHAEEGFKCAVIVNDMAALNIDKSLIDQSALVQTDEVIAMQNGCFCCTLQSDLVDQIKSLAAKKMFNYMLIEASGVSEPSQIAPLFEDCDDDHDHEEEHAAGPQLNEVARLDCCITVVDAAEFYSNMDSMKLYEEGETQGTIAELMTEQVEFSNVVILNKKDLVNQEQLASIKDRLLLLNPKAKILETQQSVVNAKELLNTHLYSREDMEENSVMISATKVEAEPEVLPSCCVKTIETGKVRCCKSKAKNDKLIDSGLSQVLLGVVPLDNMGRSPKKARHETRFGISSFVYRARRPFHPARLHDEFLNPNFMVLLEQQAEDGDSDSEDEEEEEENGAGPGGDAAANEEKKKEEKEAKKRKSMAVYVDKPPAKKQKVEAAPTEEANGAEDEEDDEPMPEPVTIFVENLTKGLTAKKIYNFFEKRDVNVLEIRMHKKKPNALVDVGGEEEAKKALALDGQELKDSKLKITMAEKQPEKKEEREPTEEELAEARREQEEALVKQQEIAGEKKATRVKFMGELLRSKGFVWVASSHEVMGGWQQAGNIIRVESEGPWMCNTPDAWKGTPNEELVLKDMQDENGKEHKFSDRRQELVFIGIKLNHRAIQTCLDDCLLTDEEMEAGPEKWAELYSAEDKLGLALELDEEEDSDDEDGDEDEEEEMDEDEEEGSEEEEGEEDEEEDEEEEEGSS